MRRWRTGHARSRFSAAVIKDGFSHFHAWPLRNADAIDSLFTLGSECQCYSQ